MLAVSVVVKAASSTIRRSRSRYQRESTPASRLRIAGEGEAGEVGADRGDLYVIVHIKEHEFFERRDSHLYLRASQSHLPQAALGAEITVRTLDGQETLRIP